MNLNEIGNLLQKISLHYPRFAAQIRDDKGYLRRDVGEEWLRIIGFLDYEEALKRLDDHLNSDDYKRIPMAMDFKKSRPSDRQEVFHAQTQHTWHIENGQLMDEEYRIYANPQCPDEPYYYDNYGRICQKGAVVYA